MLLLFLLLLLLLLLLQLLFYSYYYYNVDRLVALFHSIALTMLSLWSAFAYVRVVLRLSRRILSSFVVVRRSVQMTSAALKTSVISPHHRSVLPPPPGSRISRCRHPAASDGLELKPPPDARRTFITTNKHNQRMPFARYVVVQPLIDEPGSPLSATGTAWN